MKRFTVLLIGLIALAFLSGTPADSTAQVKRAKQINQTSSVKNIKDMKVLIRRAQIQSLVIRRVPGRHTSLATF